MTIHSTNINDTTGVWYLNADFGGLSLTARDDDRFWSKSVSELVSFVKEKGLATTVMGGSSMDFAADEGFADDDGAEKLWQQVVEAL